MPPSTGALTEALEVFLNIFESGITRIMPGTMSIFGILTAIEMTLAGLFWAMSGNEVLGKFLKKCLLIFFLVWIVNSYLSILNWVVDGFIYTGTTVVGSSSVGKSVMEDPSQVIDKGLEQIVPVFELAVRLGSDWNFFDAAVTFLCGMITFSAYMILALQVFLTRIEFALITTLGLILLPFGVLKQTSFIAEKVFGAILSFGVKFMVLALVIEIAYPTLTKYQLPTDPSWNQMLTFIAISFSFVILSLHAPSLAASLLSGTPSLNHGAVTEAASYGGSVSSNAAKAVGSAAKVGIGASTYLQSKMNLKGTDSGSNLSSSFSSGSSRANQADIQSLKQNFSRVSFNPMKSSSKENLVNNTNSTKLRANSSEEYKGERVKPNSNNGVSAISNRKGSDSKVSDNNPSDSNLSGNRASEKNGNSNSGSEGNKLDKSREDAGIFFTAKDAKDTEGEG
jgi:type IV secretion system protein TrbL